MAGLPSEVLVTKGAALLAEVRFCGFLLSFSPLFYLERTSCRRLMLAFFFFTQGFKFALAAGRQVSVLKEANLSLQADLDNTLTHLAQAQQSAEPLKQAATKSEEAYQAAMVDVRRLERCLETETVRSLRRRESKKKAQAENELLREENRLLRGTVADLEARPSFEDGYFTATYEVAQGLPTDFDL